MPKRIYRAKDPYEFGRVFENAAETFMSMEAEGSKWRGIPTDKKDIHDNPEGKRKRILQQHQFIDPRSIGLFLAHYFGDLRRVQIVAPNHFELYGNYNHKHCLGGDEFYYAKKCAEKYMPVLIALKALDEAFTSYFHEMNYFMADFLDVVQRDVEIPVDIEKLMRERMLKINQTTTNFHALTGEMAAFYMMELQKQGVEDVSDASVHYSVLNAILSAEPLSQTFLSSAKNDFDKCPFHAIGKVFSLDFDVTQDEEVMLKDKLQQGALLPFIIGRIAVATGDEPELEVVPGLEDLSAQYG